MKIHSIIQTFTRVATVVATLTSITLYSACNTSGTLTRQTAGLKTGGIDGLADEDADGISNEKEGASLNVGSHRDTDRDGIPDYQDLDSDNDTLTDKQESRASYSAADQLLIYLGFISEVIPVDTDDDGLPDYVDPDSDNDLIPDRIEGFVADTDGDGVPNFRDMDADGDGILDKDEGPVDSDGDGIPNSADANNCGIGTAASNSTFNPTTKVCDLCEDGIITNGVCQTDVCSITQTIVNNACATCALPGHIITVVGQNDRCVTCNAANNEYFATDNTCKVCTGGVVANSQCTCPNGWFDSSNVCHQCGDSHMLNAAGNACVVDPAKSGMCFRILVDGDPTNRLIGYDSTSVHGIPRAYYHGGVPGVQLEPGKRFAMQLNGKLHLPASASIGGKTKIVVCSGGKVELTVAQQSVANEMSPFTNGCYVKEITTPADPANLPITATYHPSTLPGFLLYYVNAAGTWIPIKNSDLTSCTPDFPKLNIQAATLQKRENVSFSPTATAIAFGHNVPDSGNPAYRNYIIGSYAYQSSCYYQSNQYSNPISPWIPIYSLSPTVSGQYIFTNLTGETYNCGYEGLGAFMNNSSDNTHVFSNAYDALTFNFQPKLYYPSRVTATANLGNVSSIIYYSSSVSANSPLGLPVTKLEQLSVTIKAGKAYITGSTKPAGEASRTFITPNTVGSIISQYYKIETTNQSDSRALIYTPATSACVNVPVMRFTAENTVSFVSNTSVFGTSLCDGTVIVQIRSTRK